MFSTEPASASGLQPSSSGAVVVSEHLGQSQTERAFHSDILFWMVSLFHSSRKLRYLNLSKGGKVSRFTRGVCGIEEFLEYHQI